ncbi:MAG: type II toxin-antitoxin system VapC family toxin [Chloroflexia bacterium]|nr:type II toxin-antitoxin system VapC family toxin [Chloroflexia bacterium]
MAVKWLLNEEHSDRATALYDATAEYDQTIVAPPLLPLEVTNILRQRLRAQGGISLAGAIVHLDDFLALPIEIHDPPELHHQALSLAVAHGLRPRTMRITWLSPSIFAATSGPAT